MEEREIGEVFEHGRVVLKVCKGNGTSSNDCTECYFEIGCNSAISQKCINNHRKDRKHIYYAKIEEHEVVKMKPTKIGEIFNYKAVVLKVVEEKEKGCEGCYFRGADCAKLLCGYTEGVHINMIYKEVKQKKQYFENNNEAIEVIKDVKGNDDLTIDQIVDLFEAYGYIKKTPLEEAKGLYNLHKKDVNNYSRIPQADNYIKELEKELGNE